MGVQDNEAVTTIGFETFRPLERLTIFTPLGIRFWDPARDLPIEDSLVVTAWPWGATGPVRRAVRTASGIYAFHGLPGLRDLEYPAPGTDPLQSGSPLRSARFTVAVADLERRFLPAVFTVDVPYRGIFPTNTAGPSGNRPPGFFLFSAPTRPIPPALAVVRAQLARALDPSTVEPAAFAVLEVQVGATSWYGIADERGAVAVVFPYPTFEEAPAGSPPSPLAAGTEPRWEVTARVRFTPTTLTVPAGATQPDLRSIFAQGPGVIWPARGPGAMPTSELFAELVLGQELILRTDGESTLVVGPGTSPL